MKKLLLLASAVLLASCAPSTQSAPVKDPVFAAGQVWRVVWPDGTAENLKVGQRDLTQPNAGAYRDTPTSATTPVSAFWYNPAGDGPEFIFVGSILPGTPVVQKMCFVRQPGTVTMNQSLTGAFFPGVSDGAQSYLKTGNAGAAPACSVTRIQ